MSLAPAATGNDLTVVLNDEIGLIINELGVDPNTWRVIASACSGE
jgi:hypothetical protein